MKNERLIASWDKILPDAAADARMRGKIMAYQQEYSAKAKPRADAGLLRRMLPAAACMLLLVAFAAFLGFRQDWLGIRRYSVTLENGDTLVYADAELPQIAQDIALPFAVRERPLTAAELHTLFPALQLSGTDSFLPASFKAETGELVRLEGRAEDIRITLAQSGMPLSDTKIDGRERRTVIDGIPVQTCYFRTRPNSRGIRTVIFCAEFEMNGTAVYAELAGNQQDSAVLSEKLSAAVYQMIAARTPDLSAIRFDSTD